jgi:hypothetical protein
MAPNPLRRGQRRIELVSPGTEMRTTRQSPRRASAPRRAWDPLRQHAQILEPE